MRSLVLVLSFGSVAVAQPAEPEPPPATGSVSSATGSVSSAITVGGYLEAFYQLHAQNPENRITNLRGFDNRSRTFTLANVALDVKGEKGPMAARLILQIGHTPSSYYLAEPVSVGTSTAATSDAEMWKYLQAANVTLKAPHEIVVEAGLFPSPIGPEGFAIKDNANWSRSNLFVGLPFYHTGAMVSRPLGGGWTGKLHVYNGWNSVVDNNGTPSVALSASYAREGTSAQVLYFGGVERASGAAEGAPWRHLFDALAKHALTSELAIAAQVDAGFEQNAVGTSAWYAFAGYATWTFSDELYVAVRGDYFHETVARDDGAFAAPIFWPVEWVASATATLAYQPFDGVSARLEYRHDHAAGDAFFAGNVATDPSTGAAIPDADLQDTFTVGITAWF